MAFRFSPHERFAGAIPRIALEQCEGALQALDDATEPLDVKVHEARKHVKRLRALLALAAPELDPVLLGRFTELLRSTAHTLAELRGRAALLESFEALQQRYADSVDSGEAQWVRAVLTANGHDGDAEPTLEAARRSFSAARELSKELAPRADDWKLLARGLRRTYRRARHALAKARAKPSAERLHALRTPTKRHLYQMQLLEELAPKALRRRSKALNALGDSLGEHHDVCLLASELEQKLASPPEASREPPSRNNGVSTVTSAAAQRANELSAEVLRAAEKLFARRPRKFTKRLQRWLRQQHALH